MLQSSKDVLTYISKQTETNLSLNPYLSITLMKPLLIIASAVLIAAPVQASELHLLKESNVKLTAALTAAKAENWVLACTKYTEAQQFRTKHKLDVMKPLVGSTEKQRSIHKQNVITAKANSIVNSNGSFLCGKAGIPWTNLNLVTTYTAPSPSGSSVSSIIRTQCESEWGTDYRMIKYCIDKQTAAAESLGY